MSKDKGPTPHSDDPTFRPHIPLMPEYESTRARGESQRPDIDPDDEFGSFALMGLELLISTRVALFAEGRYTVLEVKRAQINDQGTEFDLDLSGAGANAGLLVNF